MNINIVSAALLIALLYPIIKGFITGFSSNGLKRDIWNLEADLGLIAAMIAGLSFVKKIFIQHDPGIYMNIYTNLPDFIKNTFEEQPRLIYLVALPIFIFILYEIVKGIFYIINSLSIFPLLDVIESFISKLNPMLKRIIAAVFELPKAICYVIVLTFIFNILSIINVSKDLNSYINKSKEYNYVCKSIIVPIANSSVAKQLPNIINNSFKIQIKQPSGNSGESPKANNDSGVVYYNGITLDEGVKSDGEINNYAKGLVKGLTTDNEKAKKLYDWIGSNIQYDNEKADRILNNDFSEASGAIAAFDTRKGICFDYACLYVAMSRAVGIHVRLITGEGFNGTSWVGHAWNQSYVNSKWINVDTTFYNGGNYYNSKRFSLDHKDASLAGEWNS
ncbi:transglutaminase domain-containing protein [Clostridium sp. 19966]|nr:transglutaminase domain-containing protein [Clostridium sp. 19966]